MYVRDLARESDISGVIIRLPANEILFLYESKESYVADRAWAQTANGWNINFWINRAFNMDTILDTFLFFFHSWLTSQKNVNVVRCVPSVWWKRFFSESNERSQNRGTIHGRISRDQNCSSRGATKENIQEVFGVLRSSATSTVWPSSPSTLLPLCHQLQGE